MASMAPLCPCVLTRSRCPPVLLTSCRSGTRFSGGARRASSSLVPRLAPRGFPGRQEWRVESGGDERGAKKEGGGLFPGRHPLSWRRAPVGRGMQKGTGTGHGRRCALASARMTGRGILPHVDRAPGSAGVWGAARTRRREASARGVRARKNRCALASARGGGAGILPPRRSGSRFSAGRRGEERARCGPTRLNAIRPALFVRGDSLWIPAATYLPGPSPAKYCRRMRA